MNLHNRTFGVNMILPSILSELCFDSEKWQRNDNVLPSNGIFRRHRSCTLRFQYGYNVIASFHNLSCCIGVYLIHRTEIWFCFHHGGMDLR
jgi:hypothetical protein